MVFSSRLPFIGGSVKFTMGIGDNTIEWDGTWVKPQS
jgi:hypothetical protein